MLKELHRQAQELGQAAVVTGDRDAYRQPFEEAVLEQRQHVHQDAAAEQGRHQDTPRPSVLQHAVHKNTER